MPAALFSFTDYTEDASSHRTATEDYFDDVMLSVECCGDATYSKLLAAIYERTT